MTIKQQLAIEKIVENGGNVSKAMLEAGYSPNTAKTPQKLTESKGFVELMEKYLPDQKILETHARALDATKIHTSHTEPDRIVEDIPTQLKAAELAYKVKGRLSESSVFQQFNVGKDLGVEIILDETQSQSQ